MLFSHPWLAKPCICRLCGSFGISGILGSLISDNFGSSGSLSAWAGAPDSKAGKTINLIAQVMWWRAGLFDLEYIDSAIHAGFG